MASKGDAVLDAVVAALNTVSGKPAGLTVDRFRLRPASGTRITVYPLVESSQRVGQNRSPLTQHVLTARLELRAEIGSSTADQILDPLYIWAIQTLFADESLGGIANGLTEQARTWDGAEWDKGFALCYLDIAVNYSTRATNPEQS